MPAIPDVHLAPEAGVPERLGSFKINGVLGKGGMGVVFDAQTQAGQPVALKISQPVGDPERTDTIVRRFLREARILKQLDHPCVVHLVDAGDMDGVLYLAMERIEGVSLLAVRRQGPLQFDPVVQLGRQLADALAHMHGLGVVHRDIKPANILIQRDGRPVITDFGISGLSEATGITQQGDLLGSPGFMAPEVIGGHAPTPRSDQYSLGRLLFELAALGPSIRLPKNAPIFEILSLASQIDWDRFPKEGLWPQLASIVGRMLALDPGERYESADAVRTALDSLGGSLLDTDTLSEHIVQLALPTSTSYEALASDLAGVPDDSTAPNRLPGDHAEATLPPPPQTKDLEPGLQSADPRADTLPPLAPTVSVAAIRQRDLGASDSMSLENGAQDDEAATRIGPLRTAEYVQNLERQAVDSQRRLQALEKALAAAPRRRPGYWIVVYAAIACLGGLAGTYFLGPKLPGYTPAKPQPQAGIYTYTEQQLPSAEDRQNARALLQQAQQQLKARNLDRAEQLLGLCIQLADLAECHRGLGSILSLTQAPQARRYIERYLKLAPNAPDARALRQSLQR